MSKGEFLLWLESHKYRSMGKTEDNRTHYTREPFIWDVMVSDEGNVEISSTIVNREYHGNVDKLSDSLMEFLA